MLENWMGLRLQSRIWKGVVLSIFYVVMITGLTSCDYPLELFPKQANFGWSNHPADSLEYPVDAYISDGTEISLVVLKWKGSGQLGNWQIASILCLEKKQKDCGIQYRLLDGVAISFGHGDQLDCLRILDPVSFIGSNDFNHPSLAYNGKVSGKSEFDNGIDRNWLRFEVVPKSDPERVKQMIQEIIPLLQKESDAAKILPCIQSPPVKPIETG